MKKLQRLGRVLSKDEQKKIKGGDQDPGSCTQGSCAGGDNCSSLGHGCACREAPDTLTLVLICKTGRS